MRTSQLHFPSRTWGLLALGAAILFAAVLRISLSRHSLWFDELASVFFASQPLHRLWSDWMLRETNPPLYYSILHIWIPLCGLSEVSLRLPSIIVSLCGIVITYVGMSRGYGVRAAALSALLLAFSPQQLIFADEVRAYAFVYVAVALSFFGLVKVLEEPNNSYIGWIAYCAGGLAALYFHTVAFIWPAAASLALIFADRRYMPFFGSRWLRLLAADVIIVGGGSWWLAITYLQTQTPNPNIIWIPRAGLIHVPGFFLGTIFLARSAAGWLKVLPVALAILSAWGAFTTWNKPETRLAVACVILSVVFFVLLSLKQPIILDKTIFWVSVFPLVLAAAGMARLNDRLLAPIFLSILVLLGINLWLVAPKLQPEDWSSATKTLAADRHAVLIVDSESVNVNMNTSCAISLHARPCPFPIVTLVLPGEQLDKWAHGAAEHHALGDRGDVQLPPDPNIYLFRCSGHDALADLQQLGMLSNIAAGLTLLVGPLPAFVMTDIESNGHWRNGLFILRQSTPVR